MFSVVLLLLRLLAPASGQYSLLGTAQVELSQVAGVVEPSDSVGALRRAERIIFEYIHPAVASTYVEVPAGLGEYAAAVERRRRARPPAIRMLDDLRPWSDRDEWIVGQRVLLRVEHGMLYDAQRVTRECRASKWWCLELEGFVQHLLGDWAEAERSFAASIRLMPTVERCFAMDLAFLVDEATLAEHGGVDAEDRYRFRSSDGYDIEACPDWTDISYRFWWLADPMYISPGNDRYTEHRSRIVATWLMAHMMMAINERNVVPGRAVHRGKSYHWLKPSYWRRAVRSGWPPQSFFVNGWPPQSGFDGLPWDPSSAALDNPTATELNDWSSPGTPGRYTPAYGPIAEIKPQVAFFLHGDSVRVAVGLDASALGNIVRSGEILSGVVFATGPSDVQQFTVKDRRLRQHFDVMLPNREYLVSVEILSDSGGGARARFGAGVGGTGDEFGMSDILLFEAIGDSLPGDLDSMIPLMFGSRQINAGSTVGLYWETYGLVPQTQSEISVRVVPEGSGWLRRLGETLGLVGERVPVTVAWQHRVEGPPFNDRQEHSLSLDLSELAAGSYQVIVTIRGEDHVTSRVRTFEVR